MDQVVHFCSRTVMGKMFVVCALGGLFFGCGSKNQAAEDTTDSDTIKTPATVEQAAKVLDLSKFPLMDGAKPLEVPQVANLFYLATGDVKTAFEFNRKSLVSQGWKELPNRGMFSRSGFVVFVSVTPHGEPGSVQVRLLNQGNVKPGKLPVPPNAKPVYVGDSTAMYETEAAVPATVRCLPQSLCRARLGAVRRHRGFCRLQTERKSRHRDCLVRACEGRENHDPVYESANLG